MLLFLMLKMSENERNIFKKKKKYLFVFKITLNFQL